MLDPQLIEAQNAYRRPFSEKESLSIDESLVDENPEEHYVRKGDPKKPTYYIVRKRWRNVGLFSCFTVFAKQIRYALSQGYIPVIDMQNYLFPILDPEKLGKENAWEYFFEQPLRIGLEEAYNGENIILGRKDRVFAPLARDSFYDNNDIELAEWRMLVKLGLLKVKPAIMEEILAIREKLFAPTDRVLGVKLRGTDYAANKPIGHPIPPPPEYARDVILEKIRDWKCNKIFLSTEDKSIVQFFKDTFGDGFGTFCVTIDKEYVDYEPGQYTPANRTNRENDRYLNAKEYLTEMVILSKCTSFITSKCSGAGGVMMLSDGFENSMSFNLGTYGVRPIDWKRLMR